MLTLHIFLARYKEKGLNQHCPVIPQLTYRFVFFYVYNKCVMLSKRLCSEQSTSYTSQLISRNNRLSHTLNNLILRKYSFLLLSYLLNGFFADRLFYGKKRDSYWKFLIFTSAPCPLSLFVCLSLCLACQCFFNCLMGLKIGAGWPPS